MVAGIAAHTFILLTRATLRGDKKNKEKRERDGEGPDRDRCP